MPMLITGLCGYEEHGDCSVLKREIHIEKRKMLWYAQAFKNFDFVDIGKGRLTRKQLNKDIKKYKDENKDFYQGY